MKSFIAGFIVVFCCMAAMPSFAQSACTNLSCRNGVTLSVDPSYQWAPGNYQMQFVVNAKKISCRAELPLKPCADDTSVKCNARGVTVGQSGCGKASLEHRFTDIFIDGNPSKIMVRITLLNRPVVTRTIVPKYVWDRPNGAMCSPACRVAAYDLFSTR